MDFAHLDIPLRDGHIHFPHPALLGDLLAVMEIAGVAHANLVAVPDLQLVNQNAALIHAKARYPDRFTLCGALDYTVLESAEFVTREANQGRIFLDQPASAIFGIKALIGLIPGAALILGGRHPDLVPAAGGAPGADAGAGPGPAWQKARTTRASAGRMSEPVSSVVQGRPR